MLQTEKPLVAALKGAAGPTVPFWLMRQAGRYLPEYRAVRKRAASFLNMCLNPEVAAEVTLQPVRRFAMDGAVIFSDILVVPHALGQEVRYVEGEGPILAALRDPVAVDGLRRDRVGSRLAPVLETVRRVREGAPKGCAVIGFAGAPWTVAAYMVEGRGSRDFEAAREFAYRESAAFDRLIALLVEASAEYLIAQINAGADAVQIFDSWAGVLPEGAFERWCVRPVAALIGQVKAAAPGVPVIAFPRGAGLRYAGYAAATGADAVSLDTTVPRSWASAALARDSALQGNLDPVHLVVGGETMRREAESILEQFGRRPFVFNLGHGVLPQTPPEHVAQLAETIRGWRP
jgi:uroporphyrinogen decarboxylase